MKECIKCKENKSLDQFGFRGDRIRNKCKTCVNKEALKIRRSKKGLLTKIYNSQKNSSKRRGHANPSYTLNEFIDKYIEDKTFVILYDDWVQSDYLKHMIPSFDRLRDDQGYSFENLNRWMTWIENKIKASSDMRIGKLKHGNRPQKAVIGINEKTGEKIEYCSINEASRQTKVPISSISYCCYNKMNSSGGYNWKFSN